MARHLGSHGKFKHKDCNTDLVEQMNGTRNESSASTITQIYSKNGGQPQTIVPCLGKGAQQEMAAGWGFCETQQQSQGGALCLELCAAMKCQGFSTSLKLEVYKNHFEGHQSMWSCVA